MGMLRDMIKGAAIFLAVGLVLGLVAPYAAGALGAGVIGTAGMQAAAAVGHYVLWEGAFFGLFGFLTPPVQKLCNAIFGDSSVKAAKAQQQENKALEAACNEIATREQVVEKEVTQVPRIVQEIVTQGPRAGRSFAAAEEMRSAEAGIPSNVIH